VPDNSSSGIAAPTIHFTMMKEYGGQVFNAMQRYKTAATNQLLRNRRELKGIMQDNTIEASGHRYDDRDEIIN
jgi:hypothetical protein